MQILFSRINVQHCNMNGMQNPLLATTYAGKVGVGFQITFYEVGKYDFMNFKCFLKSIKNI